MIELTLQWHTPSWYHDKSYWILSGKFYVKGICKRQPFTTKGRLCWIEITVLGLRVWLMAGID